MNQKLLVVILDGWGLNKDYEGNAIARAKTPTFDRLMAEYPSAILEASGLSVGLPQGQMGTSEVNHLTIGAGRVMFQDLVRINKAIEEGSFFENRYLVSAVEAAKKNHSRLHILGLLSDGGVHSHITHIQALLQMAKDQGLKKVQVHVFTDGRDTLPRSALDYIEALEKTMSDLGVGRIASVVGRYFAMDRDNNWDRTDKGFELLTLGKASVMSSAAAGIEASYEKGIADEYIEPIWIEGSERLKAKDAVIFANFRNDRTRQLTQRLIEQGPDDLTLVTMTQYHPGFGVEVAFSPLAIEPTLGEVISKEGLRQLRITETEKFAHMTYFLNCKHEEPLEGEDRIMLDSYSDIKTHDERPEMRAPQIVEEIVQDMKVGGHEVIFTNICNGDMVGHTGNIPAAIQGCEVVDEGLERLLLAAKKYGYEVIITADHGNADEMLDEISGEILTAHSLNPVPFILVSDRYKELKFSEGTLIDVAPTILTMLGLRTPKEMTGQSLV
jgi:2,3-bisphosphoglycerate-independent phosphoglycerate mutase